MRVEVSDLYFFRNRTPIQINDGGVATPYPSVIELKYFRGTITKVRVDLYGFSHTFPEDVDILLQAPSGDKVLLLSDALGTRPIEAIQGQGLDLSFCSCGQSLIGTNTIFVGYRFGASNYGIEADLFPAPAPSAPYSTDMTDFFDKSPNGEWKLFVVDDTPSDAGAILRGWGINVETEEIIVASSRDPCARTCLQDDCLRKCRHQGCI